MDKISFDFTNKTAVVTGGAQGFGLDITKRLLRSGAKVIIWDIDVKMLEKAICEHLLLFLFFFFSGCQTRFLTFVNQFDT